MTYNPAEWPNAYWKAPAGQPWNWSSTPYLAFDLTNSSTLPLQEVVRIDDSPTATGAVDSLYANFTVPAGATVSYGISLIPNPVTNYGMMTPPPNPYTVGVTTLKTLGSINPKTIYALQFGAHLVPQSQTLTISNLRLEPQPFTRIYTGLIDQFGQWTGTDWTGKAHSVSDLISQAQAERTDLAAHPAPSDRDAYGGWKNGPTVASTGFFTTAQVNGRWWLVTPGGHLFLSYGLCGVGQWDMTIATPRKFIFQSLPSMSDPVVGCYYLPIAQVFEGPYTSGLSYNFYKANLRQKYGSGYYAAIYDMYIMRLLSWGFNTLANWSDENVEGFDHVPYTATLATSGNYATIATGTDIWGPLPDAFDPRFAAACTTSFQVLTAIRKNDPWCIGYFVDNELSWTGGRVGDGSWGLAYGALALDASKSPGKQEFLNELHTKYGDIASFNTAWGTSLTSWADLNAPYQASITPNATQQADMMTFITTLATKYFRTVRTALKSLDPNHLYLGCRMSRYTQPVAVAAAGQCDVVSFNIYRPSIATDEWTFTRTLGKPCIVGEYQFGSTDRGMFDPGMVPAPDQAGRASMFETYVESVLDNPAFVGAHYFRCYDMPTCGREFDTQNQAIGFLSITDNPYPEMVNAARAVMPLIYTRHAASQ